MSTVINREEAKEAKRTSLEGTAPSVPQIVREMLESKRAMDEARRVSASLSEKASTAFNVKIAAEKAYSEISEKLIKAMGEDQAAVVDGQVWYVANHRTYSSLRCVRAIEFEPHRGHHHHGGRLVKTLSDYPMLMGHVKARFEALKKREFMRRHLVTQIIGILWPLVELALGIAYLVFLFRFLELLIGGVL